MSTEKTARLLEIGIGSGSLDEIISESLSRIDARHAPATFVCANPHSIVEADKDDVFRYALNNAEFSVADGVGVTMAAKWIGADVGPRIAGHNYFEALMTALNQRGQGCVFFFGSSQRVLDLIAKRFVSEFPNIELCGLLSPPFGDWSDAQNNEMIDIINKAKPDVLWVGMTAPKQEKWAEANRNKLDVPIIGSIGAVFDFYAGTYPRAPQWMCKLGLEWLYRLIKEPKRMWRRNFISNPMFVWKIFMEHIIKKA